MHAECCAKKAEVAGWIGVHSTAIRVDLVDVRHFALSGKNCAKSMLLDERIDYSPIGCELLPKPRVSGVLGADGRMAPIVQESISLKLNQFLSALVRQPQARKVGRLHHLDRYALCGPWPIESLERRV